MMDDEIWLAENTGRIQQRDTRNRADARRITLFTDREMEVLRMMAHGASNQEIGAELFISRYTVAQHVASMLRKTECRTRAHLVYWAMLGNIID